MVIRNAVQCGEIQQAIERTNAVDPAILAGDPELSFKLKQQQLVELIRSGGVEEALAFAQAELSPLAEGGRLRHRALARAAAHAAPPAASRSPASSLWAAHRRELPPCGRRAAAAALRCLPRAGRSSQAIRTRPVARQGSRPSWRWGHERGAAP